MISFFIAKRYLLSKKSHHAINIISGISVCGVALATAALVCILSVFNGFQDMVAGLFTAFDPELKIVPTEGRFMSASDENLTRLKSDPRIALYSEVLEDNALVMANNRQAMVTIKGVDDNFSQLVDFKRIRFGQGNFELHADVIDYGIFGVNVLAMLGLGVEFSTPVQVYAPRGDEHIDLTDPSDSFNQDELYSPKVAFMVKQQKYDSNYVVTSLRFARNLFERENLVSAIELQVKAGKDIDAVKKSIEKELGSGYKVMDRYEQQGDLFRIMQIEKLIAYIFLTFILLIACFNIIGSLSMLIIDKKDDVMTLRNLGATEQQIANVFMIEGRLISAVGAVIGIVIGLALCLLQQHYGLIKFGQSAGSYIIDHYPVSVHAMDIIIIFATVIVVGFLSVWYPIRHLSRKYTSVLSVMLIVALVSCKSKDDGEFRIRGEFQDMQAGMLFIYNQESDMARIDTLYIRDGKFSYAGTVDQLTPFILLFPNGLEQVIFAGQGDDVHYKASANDLKNYMTDGNDENELMNEFRKQTSKLSGAKLRDVAGEFISQYVTSPVAVYLLDRYFVQDEQVTPKQLRKQINVVKRGQPDNLYILNLDQRLRLVESGQVGKPLPNIPLETRSKLKLNLSTMKTETTTLVYWASWMPDLYNFVDQFNDWLEDNPSDDSNMIIAVSLDTEIYKWERTLIDDSIYCQHVCDGRAWESPAVKQLGITNVITYLIADKNHKIVARGTDLSDLKKDLKEAKEKAKEKEKAKDKSKDRAESEDETASSDSAKASKRSKK